MQYNLFSELNHTNNSNKSSLQRITGSGNKECRNKNDFYATPKKCNNIFFRNFS